MFSNNKNNKYAKLVNYALGISLSMVKIIFWFIFACLLLLQTIIILNIWNDMPNEIENTKKAVVLYSLIIFCLIASLLMRRKLLIYISATGIIILFTYLSLMQDLSPYFGYFDSLN